MNQQRAAGMSLLEILAALLVLTVTVGAIAPATVAQLTQNDRSEVHTGAVTAARQVLEGLRAVDPSTLPSSGTTTATVAVGPREYAATVTYCAMPAYCGLATRHVLVEVSFNERALFSADTVYTQLVPAGR